MYEPEFNRSILPLLEAGDVDVLEWSFDTVTDHKQMPAAIQSLLSAYSDAGLLYGHGVYYSLLAAGWGPASGRLAGQLAADTGCIPVSACE